MGDWEEFCEANGWNVGSEDDYDAFLDSLEDRSSRRPAGSSRTSTQFATFQEAKAWAVSNPGRSFTRAPTGSGFVMVGRHQTVASPSAIGGKPTSAREFWRMVSYKSVGHLPLSRIQRALTGYTESDLIKLRAAIVVELDSCKDQMQLAPSVHTAKQSDDMTDLIDEIDSFLTKHR